MGAHIVGSAGVDNRASIVGGSFAWHLAQAREYVVLCEHGLQLTIGCDDSGVSPIGESDGSAAEGPLRLGGPFPTVDMLCERGAEVLVPDLLDGDDAVAEFEFSPHHLSGGRMAVVPQTGVAQYRSLTIADPPDTSGSVDGHGIMEHAEWTQVRYFTIGEGTR